MTIHIPRTLVALASLLICTQAWAETYYADYDKGKDSQAGTSAGAAWKHAPGDPNATEAARSVELKPGDIVLLKGGVIYRGSIEIPASGKEGSLITYKGDGWGADKAVIDGSAVVGSTWTRCTSADQLRGNKNYGSIYYTGTANEKYYTIDREGGAVLSGVYENHEFLYPSAEPSPADDFHYDRSDQMRLLPAGNPATAHTDSSIKDARHFTQADPSFYDGAYVEILQGWGYTANYRITGFDPAAHTIQHEKISGKIDQDKEIHYAILNHPAYLSGPGQYFYDEKEHRLYVWPRGSTDPAKNEYSVALGGCGVLAKSKHHLSVEGFVVEHFSRCGIMVKGSDVDIKNNVVRSLKLSYATAIDASGDSIRIVNNQATDCFRAVGIHLDGGQNMIVKGNLVQRTSYEGLRIEGVTHCLIVDNTVSTICGQHAATGILLCHSYKDVLVAGNKVLKTNAALTYMGNPSPKSGNLFIYGNTFQGNVNNSGNVIDITCVNNNLLSGVNVGRGDSGRVVFVNNIVYGNGGGTVRSHNLYTAPDASRQPAEGEVDWSKKDANDLFVDVPHLDCHLKAGSAAIGAGMDASQYLPTSLFPEYDFSKDAEGKPRPKGAKWSIGAYEYAPAKN
jgi:hypothetical protein